MYGFEIPTVGDINSLVDNHYFSSDTKPEVIADYFRLPENILDTTNFRDKPINSIWNKEQLAD
jgi:hypothetical protein